MTFGGVLERRQAGFLGSLLAWGKPGDYRDPEHVAEWVGQIVVQLRMPRTPAPAPTGGRRRCAAAPRPRSTTRVGRVIDGAAEGGILHRLAIAGTAGRGRRTRTSGRDVLSD